MSFIFKRKKKKKKNHTVVVSCLAHKVEQRQDQVQQKRILEDKHEETFVELEELPHKVDQVAREANALPGSGQVRLCRLQVVKNNKFKI